MINASKSDFIIFTRSQDKFTTRLSINNETLNRVNSICFLGLWISEDMSWDLNTREVCKKAYMRTSMLSKLKYVGVKQQDLLLIYKLFIRSCLEYCSIVYHSSLTIQQSNAMERVQRVCLRLILASEYIDYEQALRSCNLSKISQRRENRALSFAHKALKHPKHKSMFPISEDYLSNPFNIRNKEKFKVNFARTTKYKRSFIPYMQSRLNEEVRTK